MKPTIFVSTIFIIFVFLTGCQKDAELKPLPEQGYPTTYKPLSQSEWEAVNLEFQKINIHEGLALNEYGFVQGKIQLGEIDSTNPEFVIERLEDIIEKYFVFLGISNPESLNIENDLRIHIPGYVGGATSTLESYYQVMEEFKNEDFWSEFEDEFKHRKFMLGQKTIEDKSFNGPILYFSFEISEKTIVISRNWYPHVLIPNNEIYDLGSAISLTCRFIQKETGIDLWESKHKFESSKIFVINYLNVNVEIRECWKIRVFELEGLNYVYIDTQTGEILSWCIECFYI